MTIQLEKPYELEVSENYITLWEFGTVAGFENVRRWVISIDLTKGGAITIGSQEVAKGDPVRKTKEFSYFKNTLKGKQK
jgi:hypothetical protein